MYLFYVSGRERRRERELPSAGCTPVPTAGNSVMSPTWMAGNGDLSQHLLPLRLQKQEAGRGGRTGT